MDAISGLGDAALGVTIGAAMGSPPLNVSTMSIPDAITIERTVPFRCPKGAWCTAGLVVDCTENYYNPFEGQDLGTACLKCPEFSISPVRSTNVSDCKCQEGFIQSFLPDGSSRCECDVGLEIMEDRCRGACMAIEPRVLANDIQAVAHC